MPSLLTIAEDSRQKQILEAAMTVFARYGFKKTSMDEVARAADISRQGLYLHFSTKEELFYAMIEFILINSISAAQIHLNNPELKLEKKIINSFDKWMGKCIGMLAPDAADLVMAKDSLAGDLVLSYENRFCEMITKVIRAEGLNSAAKAANLNAKHFTNTLYATALGLKQTVKSRSEFIERISIAVKILCLPLGEINNE